MDIETLRKPGRPMGSKTKRRHVKHMERTLTFLEPDDLLSYIDKPLVLESNIDTLMGNIIIAEEFLEAINEEYPILLKYNMVKYLSRKYEIPEHNVDGALLKASREVFLCTLSLKRLARKKKLKETINEDGKN
jgi:hypothetical protein